MAKKMELQIGNALVVVAHPDDETIWMGGTIKRYQDIDWTIFALCRKSDPDRMPKFHRVAEFYNARGIICDFEDEGIMNVRESIPRIKAIVRRELPQKSFDYIFTHGRGGDYGHPRHKGVHAAVKQMMRDKELVAAKHFYFAYMLDEKKRVAVPNPKHNFSTKLTAKEFFAKRNVVKKMYGFRQISFENRSCARVETFTSS